MKRTALILLLFTLILQVYAQVDFMFFDVTNANSGAPMNKRFNQFYTSGKYQVLWSYWQGKPLIMF